MYKFNINAAAARLIIYDIRRCFIYYIGFIVTCFMLVNSLFRTDYKPIK